MTVWVVRHAKAGSRRAWSGDDARRPLSKPGRRQADALVELLALGIVRPRRVEPVRAVPRDGRTARGERLARGRARRAARRRSRVRTARCALVRETAPNGGVLCSHGDVITELLARLERSGIDLGDDPRCEKGSVWALELDGEQIVSARYLPPPA